MGREPAEVLLVEDNPADVRLAREVLEQGPIVKRLTVARDGVEAMQILRREGRFAESSRPDVILLDLNLPRKDGREVLHEIKTDQRLLSIPVVVLSTSDAELDVVRSYSLQANCYVTKPMDLEGYTQVVRSIELFWLSVARLPQNGSRR